MKRILLTILIFTPFFSFGQNDIDQLLNLIKNNNLKSISNYIADNVSISIHNKAGNYTKSQGEIILKDFFDVNKVNDLSVSEKRTQSSSHYAFGVLTTPNGKFNFSIFMRFKKNAHYIQEIRIESQK